MISKRNSLSIVGLDSIYLLSLRRAIVVASASTAVMMQDCKMSKLNEYVQLSKEYLELEVALKSTEASLLLKIGSEMKQSEQVALCYQLIDTDGEDGICVQELAEALQKMNKSPIIDEMLAVAESAVQKYSKHGTQSLMIEDLQTFLQSQHKDLECTFNELCQFCVSKIAFSSDGRAVLEEMVMHRSRDNGKSDDFCNYVVQARLVLIFQMLDIHQTGEIPFKRVVKHLFRFAQAFDWEGRDVLLMMEVGNERTLDINEFLEFMLNFAASLPCRFAVHLVTNAMTLSNCREILTDQDIKELFVDESKRFEALQADDAGYEDILALGKLHRLHKLMDMDKSGKLDQYELALGLRKFSACRPDLQDSIEESIAAIRSVDEDGDGLLDVQEFAKLLAKFANTAEVDLHCLIDFMVVQCSMNCNCEKEKEYMENYARLKQENENASKRSSFVSMAYNAFWGSDNSSPTGTVP